VPCIYPKPPTNQEFSHLASLANADASIIKHYKQLPSSKLTSTTQERRLGFVGDNKFPKWCI
jgi:hypothetical protein